MESNTNTTKQWLTPDDLEQELGMKKANQAQLRMNRQIPYVKIGKYVRYKREDINSWLEAHTVKVLNPFDC